MNPNKQVTITAILILTASAAFSQSLMLSVSKSRIRSEMSHYSDRQRTNSDTLQYIKDSTMIEYLFTDRLCSEASIEMPTYSAECFVQEKLDCNCWKPTGADTWQYQTNVFTSPVPVVRIWKENSVKFKYRLK